MGKFWLDPKQVERWKTELLADLTNLPEPEVIITEQVGTSKLSIFIKSKKLYAAECCLTPMENCIFVFVSYGMKVWNYNHPANPNSGGHNFQRRGLATILHKHKRRIAKDLGAKTLLASVNDANVAEIACLKKNKWSRLDTPGLQGVSLWATSVDHGFYI